jgi:hypothetical protein
MASRPPPPQAQTAPVAFTANTSILQAIKEGKGSLTENCSGQLELTVGGNTAPTKVQTSKAAQKVVDATTEVGSAVDDVTDTLLIILQEINLVTDCESLKARLRPVIKTITDSIDGVIEEMEQQSGLIAIVKVPKTPWGVVKWVKKAMLGTVLPQLKAFIKLAKKIIKLIKVLEQLIKVIKGLDEKLEKCAVEFAQESIDSVIGAIEKEINEGIDKALGPMFCKIQKLQKDIDDTLGFPTTAIDFSSTENFVNSLDAAIEDKDSAAKKAQEEPTTEIEGATATLQDSSGNVYEFKDGMLTKVTPTT